MLLLAVDTSGKNGSLALVRVKDSTQDPNSPTQANRELEWGTQSPRSDFEVLELVPLAGRMYSAQIIPALQQALSRQNLRKSDVDAYVVAAGPGSFTGLRVGLSTVKALSEVLHKPVAAVSVLEAAAHIATTNGTVTVALDAGRKQAFVGEYEFGKDCEVISAQESLIGLEVFVRSLHGCTAKAFSPDPVVRDAGSVHGVAIDEIPSPQADIFARIGYRKIVAGETTPAEVLEANYIRASDAELFSLPKLMA